jgi:hypothetical protein
VNDLNAVHWISSQSTDTVPNPSPTWVPELRNNFMVRPKADCIVEKWSLRITVSYLSFGMFVRKGGLPIDYQKSSV